MPSCNKSFNHSMSYHNSYRTVMMASAEWPTCTWHNCVYKARNSNSFDCNCDGDIVKLDELRQEFREIAKSLGDFYDD